MEQPIGPAGTNALRQDEFASEDGFPHDDQARTDAGGCGDAAREAPDQRPDNVGRGDTVGRDDTLSNVTALPSADRRERLRILEALLFAADAPLGETQMAEHLASEDDVAALLAELQGSYAGRGVNLVKVAGKWAFRTAEDLAFLLERHAKQERRLSKAALETLSIIAYHQPVTRAEIEEIRGVQTSSGTLDVLMETGWVRMRGRRRAPGRPITYGTTSEFLDHFSLDSIKDLPGLSELKGAGLLDSNLPPGFSVPEPRDVAALMPDELPLEEDEETTAELPFDDLSEDIGLADMGLADEGPADEGPADEGPADEGPADEGPADDEVSDGDVSDNEPTLTDPTDEDEPGDDNAGAGT